MVTIRMIRSAVTLLVAAGVGSTLAYAQAGQYPSVDRVFRITGTFERDPGRAPEPVEDLRFAIFDEANDGTLLWEEMQTVAVDKDGRYSVLLGSASPDGVPVHLFATAAPRWLAVISRRGGGVEQPRTLLTGVPYALHAATASDASSLGGRPASDFQLTRAASETAGTSSASRPAEAGDSSAPPLANSGTPNFIGKFQNSVDLVNSVLFDSGGRIGLGTTAPLDFLHARFTDGSGAFTGVAVQNLSNAASAYSGMLFYDHTGALGQFQGFNNSTKEYRINNIAPGGSINFMLGSASKFLVRSDGDIELPGSVRKGGVLFAHNRGGLANVALGEHALEGVTTGTRNVAVGYGTLDVHTTGVANTAVGNEALANHTSGNGNVAIGDSALASLGSGHFHVAVGYGALAALATPCCGGITGNTAVGTAALNLTTAESNTATGYYALDVNTAGFSNAAYGRDSLGANTTGFSNVAVGAGALPDNTTGSFNTAIGVQAGNGLTTGHDNIYLGTGAGAGASDEQQTLRIQVPLGLSRAFIGGIRGVPTGQNNAVPVVIDGFGQLGTTSSSRRTKDDIEDLGEASRRIFDLRPVRFTYKQPFADGSKPLQYGLIAEEVERALPELVAYGSDGQPETVKYHVLPTLVLAEVQRLERERARQADDIAQLRAMVERLQQQLATALRDHR